MRCSIIVVVSLTLLAPPAFTQNEAALRSQFDSKFVTVKIDMPASHKGIDLRFDRENPFDAGEHSSRVREHDVSVQEGQRAPVTHIKVKDDMIEFHLGGGGFNWSSDTTTQSFSRSSKTSRESDLEKRIKTETDRSKKRDMQEELDDLRRDRERRDERRRREVEDHNERARERDQARAIRGGSRFNLRFKKSVPPDALTADGLIHYLSPWVDFSGGTAVARPGAGARSRSDDEGLDWLRKGLQREDVERRLGRPRKDAACRTPEAGLDCAVVVYGSDAGDIEATFIEDVLVRFAVRPR